MALRIFISHTSELEEYPDKRSFVQAAKDAIVRAGHVPVQMNHFTASDDSTAQVSMDKLNACDVYVGLFGFRFGTPVPGQPDLSYTHLEFETAGNKPGMKRLLFVLDETATGIPAKAIIDTEYGHLQKAFRNTVLNPQHTASFFTSPDELETQIYQVLIEAFPPLEIRNSKLCPPPGLPPGYVHRPEEYEAIKAGLLAADGSGAVSISTAISGAGGFGKTTLAMKLCEDGDLRAHFDDILWVTLGKDNPDVLSRLSDLVQDLTGARPAAEYIDSAAGALAEALGEKRLLLVVDDVWRKIDIRPFLRGGRNCARLVTTRFGDVAREGKGKEVALDEMKNDEAVAMLAAGLANLQASDGPPLEHLAGRLGEYPLVLNLANGYLRARVGWGASIREAVDNLDARWKKKGPKAFDARDATERNEAVSLSMEASLEMLNEADRLRFFDLGIFPDDTDIPLTTLQALWGLDEFDAEDAVSLLADASLVQHQANEGAIRLHDVLLDYAADGLENATAIHGRLVDAWADLYDLPDHYAWTWIGRHLKGAGRLDCLRELLLDFAWMQKKLEESSLNSLIAACERFPGDAAMRKIARALRLSRQAITHSSRELGEQLRVRLARQTLEDIERLRLQIEGLTTQPRLRAERATLMPPGMLSYTLSGHSNWVLAVAITPDGQRAVSASDDNTLKVWDLNNGEEAQTLSGHSNWVLAVAITPDGQRAVSASDDNTLKVWDLNSGEEAHTLSGHSNSVNAVAITPDGQRAVSASDDNTLKVWDLNSGEEAHTLSGHSNSVNAVAITPDGQRAVSASDDNTLKVWNLNSGEEAHTLSGHSNSVNAVAIMLDGQRAVSASSDNTLKVWDLNSGEEAHTLSGHSRVVNVVAITPCGQRAVSASSDNMLKVWDLNSGEEAHTLSGHSNWVLAVAITPCGQRAVSASYDNTLKVWDLNSGKEAHMLSGHSRSVNAVAITPDGQRAVSASYDNTLKVWDLNSGEEAQMLSGHSNWVRSVAITLDGQRAVSASSDNTLKVWDLNSGEEAHTLSGHSNWVRAVAITPDGQRAVSVSDDNTLKVWDLNSGEEAHTLSGHSKLVRAVTITLDGQRAVSASDDNTLKVWNLNSGEEAHTLSGHFRSVNAVAITPDGQRAVSASDDNTLKVWDLNSGEEVHTLSGHSNSVNAVAITPDGQHTVSASSDNMLKVWDLNSGEEAHTLSGHSNWVRAVAITSDGQRAVSASSDNTLKVWDLNSGEEAHTLSGHSNWVRAVAITPDGQRAVSASSDNTLKVWDLNSGAYLCGFTADAAVLCCIVTPDGRTIVAGDASGQVHILRFLE